MTAVFGLVKDMVEVLVYDILRDLEADMHWHIVEYDRFAVFCEVAV